VGGLGRRFRFQSAHLPILSTRSYTYTVSISSTNITYVSDTELLNTEHGYHGHEAKRRGRLKVTVKFLAAAREKAGLREETLELARGATVLEILKILAANHGEELGTYLFDSGTGNPRPHLQFLLNGRSVSMAGGFDTEVTEDANLMIFPPTSGG